MISAALLTLAAQAVPAAQPSFAFTCHLEGSASDGKNVTPFPKLRPLAFLIKRIDENTFAPVQTFDPSSVLKGKQIQEFGNSANQGIQYTAFTDPKPNGPDSFAVGLAPSDSKKDNEWVAGIRLRTLGSGTPLTVGKCLLMDGITAPEFQGLIQHVRAKTNSKGELQ